MTATIDDLKKGLDDIKKEARKQREFFRDERGRFTKKKDPIEIVADKVDKTNEILKGIKEIGQPKKETEKSLLTKVLSALKNPYVLTAIGGVAAIVAASTFLKKPLNDFKNKIGDAVKKPFQTLKDTIKDFLTDKEEKEYTPKSYRKIKEHKLDEYEDIIKDASKTFKISEDLIKAVIWQESHGKKNAVSPMGAKGLMQLMPGTAKDMGVTDVYDPKQNIFGGTKYLKQLSDQFGGNIKEILAGYNWGPDNVEKKGLMSLPMETADYIISISKNLKILEGVTDDINKTIDPKNPNSFVNNLKNIWDKTNYFTNKLDKLMSFEHEQQDIQNMQEKQDRKIKDFEDYLKQVIEKKKIDKTEKIRTGQYSFGDILKKSIMPVGEEDTSFFNHFVKKVVETSSLRNKPINIPDIDEKKNNDLIEILNETNKILKKLPEDMRKENEKIKSNMLKPNLSITDTAYGG